MLECFLFALKVKIKRISFLQEICSLPILCDCNWNFLQILHSERNLVIDRQILQRCKRHTFTFKVFLHKKSQIERTCNFSREEYWHQVLMSCTVKTAGQYKMWFSLASGTTTDHWSLPGLLLDFSCLFFLTNYVSHKLRAT